MAGQPVDVQVEYLTETPDSPQHVTVNLESMRTHCRPKRVEDLIGDLVILCQDVQARAGQGIPAARSLRRIK
jgi:hypothetical protein